MDAFNAFSDDRPVECIPSFIHEASELLVFLESDNFCWLPKMKEQFLGELSLFMTGLSFSIEKDSTTAIKTTFCRRRAGKPIDRVAIRNRGHLAAKRYEDLVSEGWPRGAAAHKVIQEDSIRKAELYKWINFRRASAEKARERKAVARVSDLASRGVCIRKVLRSVSRETDIPHQVLIERIRERIESVDIEERPRMLAAYGLGQPDHPWAVFMRQQVPLR